MIEWLDTNVAYWHWIVVGLVFAASEIFIPSFFMLWLGISAIIVGIILSIIDIAFSTQLLIWTILSLICLVVWFKFISPMMKTKSLSGMALETLIGKTGIVIEHSETTKRGRIRFSAPLLGNDEWEVLCEEKLIPGDRAVVIEVSGNSLIVKKQ